MTRLEIDKNLKMEDNTFYKTMVQEAFHGDSNKERSYAQTALSDENMWQEEEEKDEIQDDDDMVEQMKKLERIIC